MLRPADAAFDERLTLVRVQRVVVAIYEMTPETKALRAGQPFPEDYRKICSVGAAYHRIPNAFRNNKNFFIPLNLKRSTKK